MIVESIAGTLAKEAGKGIATTLVGHFGKAAAKVLAKEGTKAAKENAAPVLNEGKSRLSGLRKRALEAVAEAAPKAAQKAQENQKTLTKQ